MTDNPTDNRQTKSQKATTNKNVFKQESKNERNRIYYPTNKLVGSSDIKKSDVPTLAETEALSAANDVSEKRGFSEELKKAFIDG